MLKTGNRKDALAGDWGRADEEAGKSLPGNDSGLDPRRGCPEGDHDNDGWGGCRGRRRMHGDAQLAVVGVSLIGVQVRGLSEGQQGQED